MYQTNSTYKFAIKFFMGFVFIFNSFISTKAAPTFGNEPKEKKGCFVNKNLDSKKPNLFAPIITGTTVTGTITSCQGTASADPKLQQFIAAGTGLTADIMVTAPADFEVSTTATSGYATSLTLTQIGGVVTNTTIYVRSAASAASGAIAGNITLASTGATNVDVAVTGTVNVLPIVTIPSITQPTIAVPTGTIAVNATGGPTLEYSLNGMPYQVSNSFSGLLPGSTYNISVRLQGTVCSTSYSGNPVVINTISTRSGGDKLYGSSPFQDSLWSIDYATYTVIDRLGPTLAGFTITGMNGLATHPLTGEHFIIMKLSGVTGRVLGKINLTTGVCSQVGNLGQNFSSITFSSDGKLFGATGNGSTVPESLYEINPLTAATRLVKTMGNGADGEIICYNPDDNMIYHWSGNSTVVFEKLDTITGPYTPINIPIIGGSGGETFGAYYKGGGVFLTSNISSSFNTFTTDGVRSAPFGSNPDDLRGLIRVASCATSITAGSSTTICSGGSVLLTVNGGVSNYQWYQNGVAIGGAISSTLSATTAGIYNCRFTDACAITDSMAVGITVAVNTIADAVATPSTQTIITGNAITTIALTGAVAGTTYNWTRDNTATVIGVAASGSGDITGTLVNTTASAITVTFTITPTANGCTGTAITTTVIVNPLPTMTATATFTQFGSCTGTGGAIQSFTVSGTFLTGNIVVTAPTGFRVSLTPLPGGFATSVTLIPSSGTVATTTIYVRIAGTASGSPAGNITCTSASANTVNVPVSGVVNPIPTVNALANQVLCNNTASSAIAFTGAVAGTVYNWTNNTTSIGLAASGTGNIASFTATNSGSTIVTATITVTPSFTNAGVTCTGTATIFTILVNPTPTTNTVTSQVLCNNANTLAVTFAGAVIGTTYDWVNTNTAIGLGASGTGNIASFVATNTGTTPINGTISVTPGAGIGGGGFTAPAGWTQASKIDVTENSGATLTDYQLKLNINTQALITAGQLNATGSDLRFGNSTGTTLYNYWIESGLNTTNTSVWVKIDNIPASTTKTFYMFYGNAGASAVSAVNGTFYGPNSSTDSVASGSAGGVAGSQRGFRFAPNEDVLVTDFGKREPNGTTRYVTLFDFATQAIINQTQVTGPAAQYSYTNISSPIWLTQGTDYLLELYQGASDGYYFGSSSQIGQHLTYKDMRYCNSCTQNTFPTSILTNFQYGYPDLWYYTKQNVTPAPTYVASAASGPCTGTPITFTYTVNPTPTAVATPVAETICSGATITTKVLSGTVAGTVYNWTRDNTATVTGIAASGSGDIPGALNNTTAAPVIVTFTITPSYTNGGTTCTGTPITATVIVNPVPNAIATPSAQTICSAANITTIVLSSSVIGTTYNWTRDNTATATGIAASGSGDISGALTNTTSAPVTATFTVTPVAVGGCTVATTTATVIVNPTATVNAVTNQVVCNTSPTTAITFSSPTTGGIIAYNWSNNTTSIGLAASGTGNIASFNATNTGTAPVIATITVTPTFINAGVSCVGTPRTYSYTVNPKATVNTVTNQVLCNASPTTAVAFTSLTAGGTIVYNWTNNTTSIGLAASGVGNIASFTATNTGTTPIVATIIVTPSYTNGGATCVGTPITFTITVNPTPSVDLVANQTICNGSNTTAVNFTGPVLGTVFTWTNNTTSIGLAASGSSNIASFASSNTGTAPVTATIIVTPSTPGSGSIDIGSPSNMLPYGGNIGTIYKMTLTGATSGGAIWGTNVYTHDSYLPMAAVHAGALTLGQTSVVYVEMLSGLSSYPSTLQNGITSSAWGSWCCSYRFVAAPTGSSPTCSGPTRTFTITVNPTATVNTVTNQVVCNASPTTAVAFTSPTTGGTIVYNWTNNTTSIGLAAAGSGNIASFTATNTGTAPVVATITVTPSYTNGGVTCVGTARTFTITVNPVATVTAVTNQVVCNASHLVVLQQVVQLCTIGQTIQPLLGLQLRVVVTLHHLLQSIQVLLLW
jgi:Domain of unknown function (DUF2341)/PKD-like domain/LCCL domain